MDEQVAALSRSLYIYQDPYLIRELEAGLGSSNGWIVLDEASGQLRISDSEVWGAASGAHLFETLVEHFDQVLEVESPGWERAAFFFPQLTLIGVQGRSGQYASQAPQFGVFDSDNAACLAGVLDSAEWIATLLYLYLSDSKQQLMVRLSRRALSRSELAPELARQAANPRTEETGDKDPEDSSGVILQPTTVYPYWVKPEIMELIEEDATVAYIRWSELISSLDEQTKSIVLHAATFATSDVVGQAAVGGGLNSNALASAVDWLRSPSVASSFASIGDKAFIQYGRIFNGLLPTSLVRTYESIPDPRPIARAFRVKFVAQNYQTIFEDLATKSNWSDYLDLDAVNEVLHEPHLISEFGDQLYRLWKGTLV